MVSEIRPKYNARSKSGFSDDRAEKYGRHIEALCNKKNGAITPQELLNDARKKSSPLHDAFEWDDTHAAELYRLWQARKILGAITLVIEEKKPEAKAAGITDARFMKTREPVRAFVNIRGEERSYKPIELLTKQEDRSWHEQLIGDAQIKIINIKNEIKNLKNIDHIIEVLDKLEAMLKNELNDVG